MASILWYQPAIINADDIVSCNGVIQQSSNGRTSCFRQLNQIADKVIRKKKPWCGKVDGYFFIKGHLDGLDEKGRKLSFMFRCDDEDYKGALEKELVAISCKLDNITEDYLASKNNNHSNYFNSFLNSFSIRYVIISIAILATLIVIFCLFK